MCGWNLYFATETERPIWRIATLFMLTTICTAVFIQRFGSFALGMAEAASPGETAEQPRA